MLNAVRGLELEQSFTIIVQNDEVRARAVTVAANWHQPSGDEPGVPLGPSRVVECEVSIDRVRGRVDLYVAGVPLASLAASKERLQADRLVFSEQSGAHGVRHMVFAANGRVIRLGGENAPESAIPLQVHGVEVMRGPCRLDAATRTRLLTRRRGARPGEITHVLRTFSGDSLRGRFVALDGERVTYRVGSRTLEIPRAHVAEIIALEETPPEDRAEVAAPYQVELVGGRRVSLETLRGIEGDLAGRAVGIGEVVLPGESLLRLVRGGGTRTASRYDAWRLLEPAALPVATASADGGAAGPDGAPDAHLGKAASDFELPELAGGEVSLEALGGKVVVLDFWATWCGPCVAALPALMKTARAFEDRGVVLLAVNQRESRAAIESFLAQKGWELRVLLDADGAVGRAYGVKAIPRTMVIDREGVIRHVHVGLSADLEARLARELEALVGEATGE